MYISGIGGRDDSGAFIYTGKEFRVVCDLYYKEDIGEKKRTSFCFSFAAGERYVKMNLIMDDLPGNTVMCQGGGNYVSDNYCR